MCGCPIKARTYEIKDLTDAEPDLPGGTLLEGDYNMKCIIVDKEEEENYGCVTIDFTIKKANKFNSKKGLIRKSDH